MRNSQFPLTAALILGVNTGTKKYRFTSTTPRVIPHHERTVFNLINTKNSR
jgi:hypothetical protein